VVLGAHVVAGAQLRTRSVRHRFGARQALGAQVVAGAHVVAGAEVVAAKPYATSVDACVAGLRPNNRKANPTMDTIVAINTTRRFIGLQPPKARQNSKGTQTKQHETVTKNSTTQGPVDVPAAVWSPTARHTSLLAHSWRLHGN
jgi:hypothetical protein